MKIMKKYIVGACLGLAVMCSCSSVPVTGRKQVLLVSDKDVLTSSFQQYNQFIKGAKLSKDGTKSAQVTRVGKRIADATESYLRINGLESEIPNYQWEFKLVDDPQVNAFCMPGGKIVVYTGLLSQVANDDELAVVVGHEVAHAVAKHANERMSQQVMSQYGASILGAALSGSSDIVQAAAGTVYGLGSQYGVMLPYSRKHEYEADFMGLVFMGLAGYDPHAALTFWQKMASSGSPKTAEFMSTHPSDASRIAKLKESIPEVETWLQQQGIKPGYNSQMNVHGNSQPIPTVKKQSTPDKQGGATEKKPMKTSEKWTF